ncbi:MAG: rhodanese-related sulfurtransferase [Pseudomonadota bacterium]
MVRIAAFYRFTPLPDPSAYRDGLAAIGAAADVKGSILLAPEGVNGTIAGPETGVEAMLKTLEAIPGCAALTPRWSAAETQPFGKLKVRLKKEIVTMGRSLAPDDAVGDYVAPEDWNAVIQDPDTVVIDTRNDYEVAIGTFAGAIDPETAAFGDFPEWWAENAERFAGKRVAMFCTGGIRCEKSTAFLRSQGVPDVVHLKGGILNYLETVPKEESLWDGACFVFDDRVSVEHGLRPGTHILCHACRRPLTPTETRHPAYEPGVQCHRCVEEYSDADRARFRERVRQIDLARTRGTEHLGRTIDR